MRRWNGWGEDTVRMEVPPSALALLEETIGPGRPPRDLTLEEALARVSASRLPAHPLLDRDKEARLRHSVGQSFPDWLALRGGLLRGLPEAVARPGNRTEVASLLSWAGETGVRVIPYGGGTSVVGHLSVDPGGPPTLSLSLERMTELLDLDAQGCLATFQAGVGGPRLEAALEPAGFTLGHHPQSFEYSTLGGWVATRSCGQLSLGYGRIENLLAGAGMEPPLGRLEVPVQPASAAGPDLKQLLLGSEGRLGVLTDCTVRISPLPQSQVFKGLFFPDQERGLAAVRQMAQERIPRAMIRLSLARETATTPALAGSGRSVRFLNRYLAARGIGEERCLLIYGAGGSRSKVRSCLKEARAVAGKHKGVGLGTAPGRQWFRHRFRAPYLRNALWRLGYGVDTLETAVPWRMVEPVLSTVEEGLTGSLEGFQERVHVFSHLSHVYPHGSSLYFTFLFRLAPDPEETLERWRIMKDKASRAVVASGGTISHHHGVGLDHRDYLEPEKGPLGLSLVRSACQTLDPEGIMNPGKLIK